MGQLVGSLVQVHQTQTCMGAASSGLFRATRALHTVSSGYSHASGLRIEKKGINGGVSSAHSSHDLQLQASKQAGALKPPSCNASHPTCRHQATESEHHMVSLEARTFFGLPSFLLQLDHGKFGSLETQPSFRLFGLYAHINPFP